MLQNIIVISINFIVNNSFIFQYCSTECISAIEQIIVKISFNLVDLLLPHMYSQEL